MVRPRINRDLPPYATAFKDRHGKRRIRFRRKGYPSVYAAHKPGTDEFWQEYLAWKEADPVVIGAERTEPGTFNDLISQFYRSTPWRNIPKETTKRTYRGELERFRAKYGSRKVVTMSARNITRLMEKMADTPSAANNLLKRLRTLFDYAIVVGMRRDNPAKPVKSLKSKSKGFHEWTEAEINQFQARHPIGTKAYLAITCFLYSAQRRSDVVHLGEDPEKPGWMRVHQLKTGALLSIPIHSKLREAVDACPSNAPTFLVTTHGKPFIKEGFGNWFRERCNEAGLPHCSGHGLRKAASRRLAELGLSNQVIKSITGHSTDSEVARYTKNADQAHMAVVAMKALEGRTESNPKEGESLTSEEATDE